MKWFFWLLQINKLLKGCFYRVEERLKRINLIVDFLHISILNLTVMKKTLLFLLLSINISLFGFSQSCGDSCANAGPYPLNYSDQMCWVLNEVCYPISIPRLPENLMANPDDVRKMLNFREGQNSFYFGENNMPWGGNFFACRNGGIAYRWRTQSHAGPDGPKWSEIKSMTKQQLMTLSPTEKLDIFMGFQDFRITKFELKTRGPYRPNTSDDGYCGFCNGARSAGALMPEPIKNFTGYSGEGSRLGVRVLNAAIDESLKVTFSPADIKALAAASFFFNEKAYSIGNNYVPGGLQQVDPNPGTLDFLLRFLLAKNNVPFFLDVMPNDEKWNETVLGFERKIITVKKATVAEMGEPGNNGVDSVATIQLTLWSQDEVSPIDSIDKKTSSTLANKQKALSLGWVRESVYEYWLFLDKSGKIINGKWNTAHHPAIDYIWIAQGKGAYHNYSSQSYAGNPDLIYVPVYFICNSASANPRPFDIANVNRPTTEFLNLPPGRNEKNKKQITIDSQSQESLQPFKKN